MPDIYGVGEDKLTHITSYRTPQPIAVDGDLAKPAWRDVPRSPRFVANARKNTHLRTATDLRTPASEEGTRVTIGDGAVCFGDVR